MKKYIYILTIIFTLIVSFGCGKTEKTEVSFFNVDKNTFKKDSDKPILKITNEDDIKLFEDILNSSNKINGITNVAYPNFIVEISKNSKVEEFLFIVDESSGMYSNTKDTHTWYEIDEKYLREFIDFYNDKLKNR